MRNNPKCAAHADAAGATFLPTYIYAQSQTHPAKLLSIPCKPTCVAPADAAGAALLPGTPLTAGIAVAVPEGAGLLLAPAAAAPAVVPARAASDGCGVLAAACFALLTMRSSTLRSSSSPAASSHCRSESFRFSHTASLSAYAFSKL